MYLNFDEWIEIAKTLTGLCVVMIAFLGLEAWKKEFKGKKVIEL